MDRENVIDGLEMLRFFNQRAGRELWTDKPHDIQETDIANADAIFATAIDLLKEQQETIDPIKPLDKDDDYTFLCSKCKGELFCGDVVRDHYCPTCGKRVNWETAEV